VVLVEVAALTVEVLLAVLETKAHTHLLKDTLVVVVMALVLFMVQVVAVVQVQ